MPRGCVWSLLFASVAGLARCRSRGGKGHRSTLGILRCLPFDIAELADISQDLFQRGIGLSYTRSAAHNTPYAGWPSGDAPGSWRAPFGARFFFATTPQFPPDARTK